MVLSSRVDWFVVKAVPLSIQQADVRRLLSTKGSPCENRHVESAGGKRRDELLIQELFLSLAEAHWVFNR